MPTTSETYEDSLELLSTAYATEFSDYSGTMSYLDDIWDDEVDDLISGGMSYFPPYPTGEPPVNDFFSDPLDFLQQAYSTYVPATVGVSLKQMSDALYASRPTAPSTTFGQLMGHLLSGNSNAFFASVSDAATAAKMVSALSIGASAMGAAVKVYDSQTPITEGQKQGFALAGMLIGAEAGAALVAPTGNPFLIGLFAMGGALAGTPLGQAFYDNVWADVHDDIINNAVSAIDTAERAYQAAKDYVDDLWDETGTAAQDLFTDFLDGVDGFVDDLGDLAGENGWPVIQGLPDWVPGVQDAFDDSESAGSPLVLDLAGTGINLAALGSAGSVYWSITAGDFANASGWIAEGTGLLAIDLNEDGIINDHSELFGTLTTDGFTILSAYDSNSDDAITSADDDWELLLVWTDDNSDGFSQASELHTLDDLLITSINLSASQVNYDIAGNHISHESTFTIDGNTHDIVDAWFAYDTVNTVYASEYTVDVRTLFLPTLRGYGNLPDLHIAMSMDETLLDMVTELTTGEEGTTRCWAVVGTIHCRAVMVRTCWTVAVAMTRSMAEPGTTSSSMRAALIASLTRLAPTLCGLRAE